MGEIQISWATATHLETAEMSVAEGLRAAAREKALAAGRMAATELMQRRGRLRMAILVAMIGEEGAVEGSVEGLFGGGGCLGEEWRECVF